MSATTQTWVQKLSDSLESSSQLIVSETLRSCDLDSISQSLTDFEISGRLKDFDELATLIVRFSAQAEAMVRELCSELRLVQYLPDEADPPAFVSAAVVGSFRQAGRLISEVAEGNHVQDVIAGLAKRAIGDAAGSSDEALQSDRSRIESRAMDLELDGPRWNFRYGTRDEDAWQLRAHVNRVEEELTRRVNVHLLDDSMNILLASGDGVDPRRTAPELLAAVRAFRLGESTIRIHLGSITESRAHIVVSSDDNLLTMGGGVSQAIHIAAGPEISRDAAKLTPRVVGDVVVTTAGHMPNRYVAHAITMKASGSHIDLPRGLLVRQLCNKVMSLVSHLDCRSVAFPAIGAGVAGIPYGEVAAEMGEAILDAVLQSKDPVDVELYLTDRFGGDGVSAFLGAFEAIAQARFGLDAHEEIAGSGVVDLTPYLEESSDDSDKQFDARAAQIAETLRYLDGQRRRIESQVLRESTASGPVDERAVRSLRDRLEALADIRAIYESELRTIPTTREVVRDSVFVSSTSRDLQEHRSVVRGVVDRLNLKFIGMEDFDANPLAPAELIQQKVMESNIYLGIVGMRYGFVDEVSGLSMTELEYRQAVAGKKDIRMFVMDEDAPIKASMVERNPRQLELLNDFRDRVLRSHACNLFQTSSDLAFKVEKTLSNIR